MTHVEIYKLRKTVPSEVSKYSVYDFMSMGKIPDPAHYIKEWEGEMRGPLPLTISGTLMLEPPSDYHGGSINNGDIVIVYGQPYYYDQLEGSKFIEIDDFDADSVRRARHVPYGWYVDAKEALPISCEIANVCHDIGIPCGHLGKYSRGGSYNESRPFLPGVSGEEQLNFLHPQFLKGDKARDFIELLTELNDVDVQPWMNISQYLQERIPITMQDLQDAREKFAPKLLLPVVLRPLYQHIPADADKSELAYLVDKINSLDAEQRSIFNAVTHIGWQCGSVAEIINLTETLDCFELHPAFSESMYGEFRLEQDWNECEAVISQLEKSENPGERAVARYISLLNRAVEADAYGHHAVKAENGVFTPHGLVTTEGNGEPREVYRGIEDLPPEYREAPQTSEPVRPTAVHAAPVEQTARTAVPGSKPSVLAEIVESRETARNKTSEPRDKPAPTQGKMKSDPDL